MAKQSLSRSSSLQLTSSLRHDQGIASRQRPYPTLPFAMTAKDGRCFLRRALRTRSLYRHCEPASLYRHCEPANYIAGFLFDFLYCEY